MALVEVKGISKTFGGLNALKNIDLCVNSGEIRGLIGPNGAGKTTLFNVLSGNYLATSGKFHFEGKDVSYLQNHDRVSLGIVRTFQNIRLFNTMSVLDNVKLGFHSRSRSGWVSSVLGLNVNRTEEKQIAESAKELLDELGIFDLADEKVSNLAYGNQRRVEIARALAAKPKLLLLDEPAAGMNEAEGSELIKKIKTIRDKGITIIIVEHDMRLIMSVSDRITVLAHGEKIAEGNAQEIQSNSRVREEYLGKGGVTCSK